MGHSTRRQFLFHLATAALATACRPLSRRSSVSASLPPQSAIDRDLMEVTIPRLHDLYARRAYTVEAVTQWHLARIARYNDTYRAMVSVTAESALATARAQDAEARAGGTRSQGALWGVPVVIKANTSVKGLVTSAGWTGYVVPRHELIAPADAVVVARLRAAGAIILGQTNLPDFAAGDTTISSAFGRTGNAYDVRASPGGSSGGSVTAVAANFAVLATGTDTGNSLRMPAGTSSLVGYLPTRGLVSIAGIHPLDWLLDNTGPIARTVTDAAIALQVMSGKDPADFQTTDIPADLKLSFNGARPADALRGKRFGVPAFMVQRPTGAPADDFDAVRPETRDMFMRAVGELRAAGAVVVIDDDLLGTSFLDVVRQVNTRPFRGAGIDAFLKDFGPSEYHSSAEYARAVGAELPENVRPTPTNSFAIDTVRGGRQFFEPRQRAREGYEAALTRYQLDGLVYPAVLMPPPDEIASPGSEPHSNTWWINPLGVPAVAVPAGFYANGLPFGIEMSARRWADADLLSWAHAYEQATRHRRPPVLGVRSGSLP
jgi:amidase